MENEKKTDTRVDIINREIQSSKVDTNLISDGYHTFGELYEHRCVLFIALCREIGNNINYTEDDKLVWRSKAHSDDSVWDGWFILGIGINAGRQITYHLPIRMWVDCDFATTLDKAPDYDGHTSNDVLERLKNL